jgi:hypothetical protein
MKIENCVTSGNLSAVTAPFIRTEPEEDWVKQKDARVVPLPLFGLYARAGFLSFGSEPRFLQDEKQFLFGYFSMILESLKGTLVDADRELAAFIQAQSEIFDLGKEERGEKWDLAADGRAKNHFRTLVLCLSSSLDLVAETIAIMFTDQIARLRVGKADFERISTWLEKPIPNTGAMVVTPQAHWLGKLHSKLSPIVWATGCEKDWLPLMNVLRNKAAHLGTGHFREIGFHDNDHRFYRFLPRNWPVLWEEHIGPQGMSTPFSTMTEQFMREDNMSYARGLRAKITALIDSAFGILEPAYAEFKHFDPNQSALAQLRKNTEVFEFECFEDQS